MSLKDKLTTIQTELKAPKNLRNNFGNYNYRNAEGICEAVKPFLKKQKCSLVLSDEIMEILADNLRQQKDYRKSNTIQRLQEQCRKCMSKNIP